MAELSSQLDIGNIKRCTADEIVYEALLTFDPKPAKHETLSDLFRNIKKEQQLKKLEKVESDNTEELLRKVSSFPVFQTAKQVLDRKNRESTESVKKSTQNSITDYLNSKETNMFKNAGKRKDLKSLFGDEESDDENIPTDEKPATYSWNSDDSNNSVKNNLKIIEENEKKRRKSVEEHKDFVEEKRKSHHHRSDHKKKRREDKPQEKPQESNVVEEAESFIESEQEKYKEVIDLRGDDDKAWKRSHSTDREEDKKRHKDDLFKRNHSPERETQRNNFSHRPVEEVVTIKPQNGEGSKRPRLKKAEIGGLVVKLLTPAYAEKRFESRDVFKTLARNISHALADKDEQDIKEYVRKFLDRNEEITSHTTL